MSNNGRRRGPRRPRCSRHLTPAFTTSRGSTTSRTPLVIGRQRIGRRRCAKSRRSGPIVSALAGARRVDSRDRGCCISAAWKPAAAALETVSLVSAVAAGMADTALAATGKGSWTSVGVDAFSLAPAGLGKLVTKFCPINPRIPTDQTQHSRPRPRDAPRRGEAAKPHHPRPRTRCHGCPASSQLRASRR